MQELSNQGKRKAAKPPVSAHPAFPAIVSLWFAALFGIGSLVLPAAIYERFAEATGLAAIFTAAQAPLGVTARILIALVAAAVGAVAGIEIARKVAASAAPHAMPRRAPAQHSSAADEPAAAKRPISAHEELGFDSLDAAGDDPAPAGRPTFAVTEDSATSELLDFAPMPETSQVHDAAEFGSLDPGDFAGADSEPEPFAQGDESFDNSALSAQPAPEVAIVPPAPQPAAYADSAPTIQTPAPFGPAAGEPAIADLVARFARALESHRAMAAIEAVVPATAVHAFDAPVADDVDGAEETEDSSYSSLLAIKNPASLPREVVRINDDRRQAPAMARPLDAPQRRIDALDRHSATPPRANAGDTERALRVALEKLQRMSGAA